MLCVKDGQVEPPEKPRTRKRAIGRVQILAEQVAARFDCVALLTVEADPIIGTHGGPGTLGVVFYAKF